MINNLNYSKVIGKQIKGIECGECIREGRKKEKVNKLVTLVTLTAQLVRDQLVEELRG